MSDTAFPTSGGWVFFQPQTQWRNPMALVGKAASIAAIQKHRLANPAIAAKHNLSTEPAAIEQELIAFQQARGALPPTAAVFFSPAQSRLPSRVVAAAGDLRTAAKGTAVVLDWLTSGGKPIEPELATARAKVCVACPLNQDGSWFTVAPAELLKATVETWRSITGNKDFKFSTPYDDKLKSCYACKCLLSLKVWVDSKHILGHTAPEVFSALHPSCWILAEKNPTHN